jgi:branched-subunit amino acid transport protein
VSTAWVVIIGSSIGIYAVKAAGPLLLGGRPLPKWLLGATMLLPATLLAALVAVSTVASGQHLAVDARLVGVLAAAGALGRRANFVVVILVAAVATAATRALS